MVRKRKDEKLVITVHNPQTFHLFINILSNINISFSFHSPLDVTAVYRRGCMFVKLLLCRRGSALQCRFRLPH